MKDRGIFTESVYFMHRIRLYLQIMFLLLKGARLCYVAILSLFLFQKMKIECQHAIFLLNTTTARAYFYRI